MIDDEQEAQYLFKRFLHMSDWSHKVCALKLGISEGEIQGILNGTVVPSQKLLQIFREELTK